MIEAYNTTTAAITAGQTAPLTSYNLYCDKNNASLSNSSIVINEPGTYVVSADFIFAPTSTSAELEVLVNGTSIPQAARTITVTAATETLIHTQAVVQVSCCCPASSGTAITFVYPAAGTQSDAQVIVQRVK